MKIGDIFRKMFGKNPSDLTVQEIEKLAIHKPAYNSYATGLVSKRGNVFKNQNIDLDKMIDNSLQNPLSALR